MKLVALDVGEKRIGAATADSSVRIAVPHSTINVDGDELAKIAKIMQEEGAKHLIVGLPRNASGEETAQSRAIRSFVMSFQAYMLKNKFAKPLVKFQDESLTSAIAEAHLALGKKTKKRQKADIDREAATIILQDFLDGFGGDAISGQTIDAKSKKKSKRKRGAKSMFLRILAVIIGLMVVTSVVGVTWYADSIRPATTEADCGDAESEHDEKCVWLEFVVEEGESTTAIIDRLEAEKIIRSALAFKIYLRLNHGSVVVRVGMYELNSSMSIEEILEELQKGSLAETFKITFLPGGTVADAKKRLVAAGYAQKEVDAAFEAEYDHPVLAGKPAGTLEGYIFGETYEFYVTDTVEEVLMRTFDELFKVVQENNLIEAFEKQGLNLYEGIKLASIVQREASRLTDQAGAAQVFLLRLKKGIALGSDVVIGYAADQINPNRDKTDTSYINTIQCPWNSRKCPGLPPTPISSPGKSALLSVAHPAEGAYLYFLVGDDGVMRYAYDESGHQKNIRDYCREMCKLL